MKYVPTNAERYYLRIIDYLEKVVEIGDEISLAEIDCILTMINQDDVKFLRSLIEKEREARE